KFDLRIEFNSTNLPSTLVFWNRKTSIDFIKKISKSLNIYEWMHIYDLAGGSGEASNTIQDKYEIFYIQTYTLDKQPITASQPTLFQKLSGINVVFNSSKILDTCKTTIQILDNYKNISFGARLEYRISYNNTESFAKNLIERNDISLFL
ncbi:21403_t:CDS:1, partial [Dentiscutata erythropus]